jgi:carbamoyltransferase
MKLLGINSFTHDSAVAVVEGGEPLFLLEEERLSRRKHHDGFVFAGGAPSLALEEVRTLGPFDMIAHSHAVDHAAKDTNLAQLRFLEFARRLDPTFERTVFLQHHLCHAAAAFYCSPFTDAYVCTLDSRGDGLACLVARGTVRGLETVYEAPQTTSLCAVYSHATESLGLGRRQEGKLMALAAFGQRADLVPDLFRWTGFSFAVGSLDELGTRAAAAQDFQERADVALSVQQSFEDAVLAMLGDVCADDGPRDIALAGGGFLNVSLNGRVTASSRWDRVFVAPAAGDSGTALGAAMLAAPERTPIPLRTAFYGPEVTPHRVRAALTAWNLSPRPAGARDVVALLLRGLIGAVFAGRMEFGPRALGNRSLLADPARPEARERLNEIKRRPPWMPVAPSILDAYADRWVEGYVPSPFMTTAFAATDLARAEAPATVAHDGTMRIQSVDQSSGLIWEILSELVAAGRPPVLCNTSFNVREPIVSSVHDAVATFYSSPMDFLYCEGWLLTK